jgi:hypothetical protein
MIVVTPNMRATCAEVVYILEDIRWQSLDNEDNFVPEPESIAARDEGLLGHTKSKHPTLSRVREDSDNCETLKTTDDPASSSNDQLSSTTPNKSSSATTQDSSVIYVPGGLSTNWNISRNPTFSREILKRRLGEETQLDGSPSTNSKRQATNVEGPQNETRGRRFACPYYQNNPRMYSASKTCLGPGFSMVRRLK